MDDDDEDMVNFELEAAEALAVMARCNHSQGPEMDIQHASGYMSNTVTVAGKYMQSNPTGTAAGYASNSASKLSQNSDRDRALGARQCSENKSDPVPENREKIIRTIPECSAGNKSNSASRLKKNLNEAERDARRLRRVMANRESARQTIRRRQGMYLELSRKAADLSEENENLKKAKEIALKQYNSLKGRNKFLKAQVSKIKKAERLDKQKEANLSQEKPSSAPMFYRNQHPMVPCFWPPILQSSDIFQYHCASHPDAMSSSQFVMPNRCQGQENSTNAGTPVFVLPVPWFLPFPTHGTASSPNANRQDETPPNQQFSTCSCSKRLSSDSHLLEDHIRFSLDLNVAAEASDSTRSMSWANVACGASQLTSTPEISSYPPQSSILVSGPITLGRAGNFQANDPPITDAVSGSTERMTCGKKSRVKTPEESFVASEARRKRKELMKLKNVHCRQDSARN